MAKEYHLQIDGHPSIYKYSDRKLDLYFCEPDSGVNKETGILLLIPGFGANSQSNVYKKMRKVFADQYNLVTVQCDYFGWEFMQSRNSIELNTLREIFTEQEFSYLKKNNFNISDIVNLSQNKPSRIITENINLNEDLTNFNDMGIMQALDNITAVNIVIDILKQNNLQFHQGKIILFGHSHGAYLAHLCNAFAPNLFTLIIDNSAWLFPAYIKNSRFLYAELGNINIQYIYSYLISKLPCDEELLFLPSLYKKFKNSCTILCYQGTSDNLVAPDEKREFCKAQQKCFYYEVSANEVDGKIFKSTDHGLGADFFKLFDFAINNKQFNFDINKNITLQNVDIQTKMYHYQINYDIGRPLMNII